MANYYVTKNQDGTWNAKRENAERASSVHSTQRAAEKESKRLSANSGGGEVRIHGRNARFRDSDTVAPANDPFPPRDTRH